MKGLYSRWMAAWEDRLANADTNRISHPFEWGLDWLGITDTDPAAALVRHAERSAAQSEEFYRHQPRGDYRLTGSTLTFTSEVETPFPENNTVHAEYFPAEGPAKMACGVSELCGGAKIEIQVIALAG